MTLREVAEKVGVHESTVSRAINGKYMQSPRGCFELKYFFTSGVYSKDGKISSNSIKYFIKEFIENEDLKKPLSDQKIVDMLDEKGIDIKRRTVAKYREELNILSSSKRRRY
jgi:RNA polymerase sigma-54 factor